MKIGIAMAVYQPDPIHFLEQLRSIQSQTFKEWICVLSFDSELESYRTDSRFAPFFEDGRFTWVRNGQRLGVKKNFEAAIAACVERGCAAIACSDQDDIWYPKKLEMSAAELSKNGPLSLVHCDMHLLVEDRGGKATESMSFIGGSSLRNRTRTGEQDIREEAVERRVGDRRIEPVKTGVRSERTAWEIERRGVEFARPQHLLVRNIVAGAGMLFDAELARRYPVIPDGVPFHDHWFALVASFHGGVYPIYEPLYSYRQHGGNVLGVTEYKSVFHMGARKGLEGASQESAGVRQTPVGSIFAKCRQVYKFSRGLARAAVDVKILKSPLWQIVFLKRFDLGFGFLALGFLSVGRDQPLVRACLARAVGKFLSIFDR